MQKPTPVQWLLVAVGAVAVLGIVGLSYYLGISTQKPSGQSVQVVPTKAPGRNISPTKVVPTATPTPTKTPIQYYPINNNAAK